jgi:hypothetical protein
VEYVTGTSNQLESRQARGNFRADMQNGDSAGATYAEDLEALVVPTVIAGIRIPAGSYTFQNARVFYTSAPQRDASRARSLSRRAASMQERARPPRTAAASS